MMKRVTKETVAKHLGWAIRLKIGKRELDILIFGWLKYRKYGHKYRDRLYHRDWLYITEIYDLSDYAGYNILTGDRLPDK